jgi:Fe2+ or Zn2+ uptake regulation protein
MKENKKHILGHNLFEVSDDLPEDLRKHLKKDKVSQTSKRYNFIMSLFKIKEEISVDDILIAYYKMEGIVLSRQQVYSIVAQLIKKKRIVAQGEQRVYKIAILLKKEEEQPTITVWEKSPKSTGLRPRQKSVNGARA